VTYKARVVVTGASGFIGHHLTSYLKDNGYWVRGVDVKRPEYGTSSADEFSDFTTSLGCLGLTMAAGEKSPAAICRKVATSGDSIEVWGDGEQTRSYCYIDDCVEGIYRIMRSAYHDPLNLGQDRMISINHLVDMVAEIAGKKIYKAHDLSKPQGVRGRNSDNTRQRQVLEWEPAITLEQALRSTYDWISAELVRHGRLAPQQGAFATAR
jgi:GDP-D-mannose 3', 5'-epimerase